MKKILVPVDFSDHTGITCTYALELAQKHGSEIMLFHTFFDQFLIAESSFPESIDMSTIYHEELLKEILHQAEKSLDTLFDQVMERINKEKYDKVTLSKKLTSGTTEHEIIMACEEYAPDIIIMGIKENGKSSDFWGRVSTYVINHTNIPVMAIPEIKKFLGYTEIIYAADLSEGNNMSIQKIVSILKPYSFRLHIVHFSEKKKRKGQDVKMEALKNTLTKDKLLNDITFDVVEVKDDVHQALELFIQEKKATLIAFQPQKHKLFYNLFTKNLTKKDLFVTNVPLLAVPE